MIPVTSLAWTLPSSNILEFGALRNVGDVRNSSDGNYIATLTQKMEDDDPNSDRFFYTSTLLVLEPVNGLNLTCTAVVGSNQPKMSITTATSGKNYSDTIIMFKKSKCNVNFACYFFNQNIPDLIYAVIISSLSAKIF